RLREACATICCANCCRNREDPEVTRRAALGSLAKLKGKSMACVDNDKFNLQDHGTDAAVALKQLLLVPGITKGVLGKIIPEIQTLMTNVKFKFTWIPNNGTNAGNAAGFFKVSRTNPNGIALERVAVTVMEGKRGQVLHELVHALDMRYYYFNISHPPNANNLAKRVPVLYLNHGGDV